MGVYRIDPDGSLHRVVADAGKPNGILVSSDQKTLYVVSHDNGLTDMGRVAEGTKTHPGRMALLVYDLAPDGSAVFRKTLIDYSPQDGPDGLVADVEGDLYVAVRDGTQYGIFVYSPEGKELAYIPTPELPTNTAFGRGAQSKTLYISAGGNLYRISVKKDGYQLPVK